MNDLKSGAVLEKMAEESESRAAACRLELVVEDPMIVPELLAYPAGEERDEYALTALRIGVLALKQAQGRLDADVIRGEGDRLLGMLEERLGKHERTLDDQIAGTLRDYFDPNSGRFNERVERLVCDGGDLERLLRTQIGESDSVLAKTLTAHFGEQGALMKVLRPTETEGILNSLKVTLDKALETQRETIVGEFSLDEEDSALARLKKEIERLIEKSNRENDEFRADVRA